MRTRFILTICSILATGPAIAQGSLGFNLAEVTASVVEKESGSQDWALSGSADFTITENHGVQFDLAYTGHGATEIGHLGGHLYLAPQADRKYGVFASYSDMNEKSVTVANAGFEAMFALGDNLIVEARFGLGVLAPGNVDYIFAGGSVNYAMTEALELRADVSVTDIDELAFAATAYDLSLGAIYHLDTMPIALSLDIGAIGLEGRDAQAPVAYARLGLTYRFGGGGKANRGVATRLFKRHDPVDVIFALDQF